MPVTQRLGLDCGSRINGLAQVGQGTVLVDWKLIPMRLLDVVHGYVRSIARTRRPQRLPRPVVRVHLQILDLAPVHHPHQVGFELLPPDL